MKLKHNLALELGLKDSAMPRKIGLVIQNQVLDPSSRNPMKTKSNANEIQSKLKQTNSQKYAMYSTKMCKPNHSKAKNSPNQIQSKKKPP